MITLGKFFAVLLWIPLLIWSGASGLLEKARGAPEAPAFVPGVTFSTVQAKNLGLDPRETYIAILDDLGARRIRIAAYWPEVEPQPGAYDWSLLDFQISEAEKRNAKLILTVGMKTPRWPECHIPDWTKGALAPERDKRLIELISKIVIRYQHSPAISMWQVENEPFFKFGDCPVITYDMVEKEVSAVRLLDDRPVAMTDSGELSNWFDAARLGDLVGTTMYRRNLTRFGYIEYPLPPRFYEKKATLIKRFFGDEVFVVEMQAEPWMRSPRLSDYSVEEQFQGLDFARFQNHVAYARASRLSPVYFWGVEWWYWLSKKEHPEFWDYAKKEIWQQKKEPFEPSPIVSPTPSPLFPLFTATLKLGMRGDEVKRLQEVLRKLGFFPKAAPLSGVFGPVTEKAVKDFQKAAGLQPVGVVGPQTRKALNEVVARW